MRAVRAVVTSAALASTVACGERAPDAAPQLVLVVDTDAHVAGELDTRDDVSPDATIDTLRVDVLGTGATTNSFVVGDPAAWPVSFGVVSGASRTVTLRLRLFRGLLADPGVDHGVSVLDPPPPVTIDRTVILDLPASGVARAEVFLAEDCMGSPSSFLAPMTTCIDGDNLSGDPASGVQPLGAETPSSQVGTWAPGVDVDCASSPKAGRACIPGGFGIMGEPASVGISAVLLEPVPYHPMVVSPFHLDVDEVTVGALRKLVASGKYGGALPSVADPTDANLADCTWLAPDDPTNDSLPVNCIDIASAAQVCAARGGALPTEAQWNHAARGRGQRRLFPWGDMSPQCCSASAGRNSLPNFCGSGPEPVGSHMPSAACGGVGDVTRDGIVDMGGSITEAVADDLEPYDAPCWNTSAILQDPVCRSSDPIGPVSRGGDWQEGIGRTSTPLRLPYLVHSAFGFRCAYEDGP